MVIEKKSRNQQKYNYYKRGMVGITIYFDKPTMAAIRELAVQEDRSIQKTIRRIVRGYFLKVKGTVLEDTD